jgi:hypothetical protein
MSDDGQTASAEMQGMTPQELPTVPVVPELGPLWKRFLRERKAKAPRAIDAAKVNTELQGVKFGMRCMMILGGYRFKKGLKETDEEIQKRADATVTLIMNVFMMVRAAEDVIVRHGLTEEYKAQLAHLQSAIAAGVPQPTGEELLKLQEMLGKMAKGGGAPAGIATFGDAAKGDGNGGNGLSEAGERSDDPVGEAGV